MFSEVKMEKLRAAAAKLPQNVDLFVWNYHMNKVDKISANQLNGVCFFDEETGRVTTNYGFVQFADSKYKNDVYISEQSLLESFKGNGI